jgi:trimeric autotransporter adhesin
VLTVTNQLDAGAGSLRQAILNANASPTLAKTINFNIRAANNTPICPAVIALSSNLPALAAPIVIDGYSQPGATVNTSALAFNANLCVLLKPASGSLGAGLIVPAAAAASTSLNLRGIGMGAFSQPVMLLGGSGHVLAGNQFGGTANAVTLPGAALNAIAIGVNAGGRLIVGGANVSDRNVISGALFDGINIQTTVQSSTDQCQIVNNLIGLAPNGINLVANNVGVNVGGSGCAIVRNRIVGNTGANIWLNGADSTGNVVQQNIIGVTVTDTGAPSFAASVGVLVTGSNNVIGAGESGGIINSNTIRYMVGGGVVIKDSATSNSVNANAIYDNGATGNGMDIDLLPTGGTAGNTPNDVGDVDSGPNQLQNFPVPTGLLYTATGSVNRPASLSATLDSKPGSYRIDAYFASSINSGGRGHAQLHLGRSSVTVSSTPANFSMAILVPDQSPNGVLSFTATDSLGNTSEVGTAISIVAAVQDAMFRDGFE